MDLDEDADETAVEIDAEGVVRMPRLPRQALVVIRVELLERMLTEVYGEGLRGRRDGP